MFTGVFTAKEKWEKDADVRHCRRCSKPFGLMTRKSHCRLCGRIFCGDCVHALAVVVEGKSQTVKACQRCLVAYHDAERRVPSDDVAAASTAPQHPPASTVTTDAAPSESNVEGATTDACSSLHVAGSGDATVAGGSRGAAESSTGACPFEGTTAVGDAAAVNLAADPVEEHPPTGTTTLERDGRAGWHEGQSSAPANASLSDTSNIVPTPPVPTDGHTPPAHQGGADSDTSGRNVAHPTPQQQHQQDPPQPPQPPQPSSSHANAASTTIAPPTHHGGATDSGSATTSTSTTSGATTNSSSNPKRAPTVRTPNDVHRQRSFTVTAEESRASISLERSEVFDFCRECGRVEDRCTCPREPYEGTDDGGAATPHLDPQTTAATHEAPRPSIPTQPRQGSENSCGNNEELARTATATATTDGALSPLASTDRKDPLLDAGDAEEVQVNADDAQTGTPSGAEDNSAGPTTTKAEEGTTTCTVTANATVDGDDGVSVSTTAGGASSSGDHCHLSTSASFGSAVGGGSAVRGSNGDHANIGNTSTTAATVVASPTIQAVMASNRLAPDALASSTTSSTLLDPESAKVASRCARFLKPAERILKIQTVSKTRYMMSHVRVLVLTDFPRLFYVDESNVLKGSLVLDPRKTRVVSSGPKTFVVTIDGGKDYNFTTAAVQDTDAWVQKLHGVLLS